MTRWQTVVATVAAMAFFWSGPEAAGWIIRHHREACATAAPADCLPTDCAAASDGPPVVGSAAEVGQLPPASPSAPVPPPTPSVPPTPTPTPSAPTPPTPTPTPTPPKLHVLLLVDDGNKDTGAANKAGAALLEKALRAGVAADRLGTVETLAGAAIAPDRVRTRIAALGVRPQDTLACFYSGAAEYDEATRAYTLVPTGADRMPRAELRNALLARRARLTVLLTDAPANRVLPDMLPPYQPPAGPVALDRLLFENRGLVDVHAAAASQIAFPRGTEGGLFALGLVDELRHLKPDAPAVTWLSFVERVRGATDRMYVEFRKAVLLSDKVSAEDKRAYRDQAHQTPTALTPLDQVRPVVAPSGAKPTTNPRSGEIVVHVPPGARVFVEDRPTTQTGPKRYFETAELLPGQAYTYAVRAELGRDGRVVSETKRVTVRAGESVDVQFEWAK